MKVLLAAVLVLAGCSDRDEERARRDRELQAEIAQHLERYRKVIEAFLAATSSGAYDRAYEMLAPSYTNMVTKERFIERIRENRNFAKPIVVEVQRTVASRGTLTAECRFGELGAANVSFAVALTLSGAEPPQGPRISAITIGGMPALPTPP